MEKRMVQCEDGRRRHARVYGIPRDEGDYLILKAGVRLKGKQVSGEAWRSKKTGVWYFLTNPEGKNSSLLPRRDERPSESSDTLLRSPSVKTE